MKSFRELRGICLISSLNLLKLYTDQNLKFLFYLSMVFDQ